ncbi:MAG: cytochrome c [Pseudomonadota bacterium]
MRRLTLALIVLLAAPASAQDAEAGRLLYMDICAACHGIEATGQGPMVEALTIRPTDLTQLSANNDGTFPIVRVVFQIDGRDPMIAHGGPMPIFGPYLKGGPSVALRAPEGTPILTSPAIADLVAYLEAIQS